MFEFFIFLQNTYLNININIQLRRYISYIELRYGDNPLVDKEHSLECSSYCVSTRMKELCCIFFPFSFLII